jgi:hypothetical protein
MSTRILSLNGDFVPFECSRRSNALTAEGLRGIPCDNLPHVITIWKQSSASTVCWPAFWLAVIPNFIFTLNKHNYIGHYTHIHKAPCAYIIVATTDFQAQLLTSSARNSAQ